MKKPMLCFLILMLAAFAAFAAEDGTATPAHPVLNDGKVLVQSGNCPTLLIINSPSGCAIVVSKTPGPNCQRTRYSQGTVITIVARPNTGLGYSVLNGGSGCDSFTANGDGTYTCVVTITSPSTSQAVYFSCS